MLLATLDSRDGYVNIMALIVFAYAPGRISAQLQRTPFAKENRPFEEENGKFQADDSSYGGFLRWVW